MSKERGELTVIYGPMYAGKTTETIKRFRAAEDEGVDPQAFKPSIDDRYGDVSYLWSHDQERIPTTLYDPQNPEEITQNLRDGARLILLDEVQFAAPAVIGVVGFLLEDGRDVVCIGLDLDSDKQPFGQTLELAKEADNVLHLLSRCYECREDAPYTKATFEKKTQTDVGAADKYVPACETHHES